MERRWTGSLLFSVRQLCALLYVAKKESREEVLGSRHEGHRQIGNEVNPGES